ncbi:sensor histidine kinase [Streptomyces sp. NPDC057702]|uniref:sensor histidine kinase n=1 Tax=unclassified Streptomyces TaxID=2593676 RepID=UPI0036A6957D
MSAGGEAPAWTPSGPYPIRLAHGVARRARDLDARYPVAWDLFLTSIFALGACVDVGGGNWRRIAHSGTVPVALVAVMAAGFVLSLLWHRRRPLAAFYAMTAIGLVDAWVGTRLQVGQLGQLMVLFHIALRLPSRALTIAGALTVAQAALSATRWPSGDWTQAFLSTVTASLVAALLGIVVRSRRAYTASLVERARQLEVERDQQAQLATAAERTRIAREMHDIIGHNLSVITSLADGGSYAARKSPERAAQALEAIGTTSRQALDELRRLLGVLRDDRPDARVDPELGPQPTLADLGGLVERVRAAGLTVRLTECGTPTAGSPGRELTVYRVVQEALTNTLKHAGPRATATVEVTHAPHALSVAVTDTGAIRGAARRGHPDPTPFPFPHTAGDPGDQHPADRHGRGLRGMRERAALYDGTVATGPRPGGGWGVRLELPTPGSTPRGPGTSSRDDALTRPPARDAPPAPDARTPATALATRNALTAPTVREEPGGRGAGPGAVRSGRTAQDGRTDRDEGDAQNEGAARGRRTARDEGDARDGPTAQDGGVAQGGGAVRGRRTGYGEDAARKAGVARGGGAGEGAEGGGAGRGGAVSRGEGVGGEAGGSGRGVEGGP